MKVREGDILLCIKKCVTGYGGAHVKGKIYKIVLVEDEGNENVYIECEHPDKYTSTAFSQVETPNRFIPYSKYYLYEYFVTVRELRDKKLIQLGI